MKDLSKNEYSSMLSEVITLTKLWFFGNDGQGNYCNQELKAKLTDKERRRLSQIKACIRNCREDGHGPAAGFLIQTLPFLKELNEKYKPAENQTKTPHPDIKRGLLPPVWN